MSGNLPFIKKKSKVGDNVIMCPCPLAGKEKNINYWSNLDKSSWQMRTTAIGSERRRL